MIDTTELHPEVKDNINNHKPKYSQGISVGIEINFGTLIAQSFAEETIREYLRRTRRCEITNEELNEFIKASTPDQLNQAQTDFKQLPPFTGNNDTI